MWIRINPPLFQYFNVPCSLVGKKDTGIIKIEEGITMGNLLYEDLTERIRQAAFEVHKYFGNGFLEKVYENALTYKLRQNDIQCDQQVPVKVYFENDLIVGEYFADLLVENKIVIELKAIETIDKIHYVQLKNYLKATKYRLGLLINFGRPVLMFKRIIF
jgi:GxxExxY protein